MKALIKGLINIIKVMCLKIKTKHLCIAVGIALFVSVIPLLYISQYNYPIQDDFAFSSITRHVYEDTGSIFATVRAALEISYEYYFDWQGSYASCFLFALQPGIWSDGGYAATTYLMLASLIGGTIFFIVTAAQKLAGADKYAALLISFVVSFICVQQVPNANQSFYWYNGSVYYTFFHGLFLSMLSVIILYIYEKKSVRKKIYFVCACLLAPVIGGGNYVTALSAGVILCLVLSLLVYLKKHEWRMLLIPTALFMSGFLISVVAPGNQARKELQSVSLGLVGSVIQSFFAVFTYANEWAYAFVLLAMLFLASILWKTAGKTNFTFKCPLIISAGSVCYLAVCMFPHIYATATPGPDRLTNIVFFNFVIVITANLFYWLGWLRFKISSQNEANGKILISKADRYLRSHAVGGLALFFVMFVFLQIAPGRLNKPLTAVQALTSIKSGEAAEFGRQMKQRHSLALQSCGKELTVPPITVSPELLAYGKIYADTQMWDNQIFADYYRLASIKESE